MSLAVKVRMPSQRPLEAEPESALSRNFERVSRVVLRYASSTDSSP